MDGDGDTRTGDDELLDVLDAEVRRWVADGGGSSAGGSRGAGAGPDEELLRSLVELGELLLDETDVDASVTTVLQVALRTLGATDHAVSLTISELHEPQRSFVTRDATTPWARELDEWQYEHGEGPCLLADETGETCVVEDCSTDTRFPTFAAVADEVGVEACVSFPMLVRGRSLGSINVFYRDRAALRGEHVEAGEQLARAAAPLLANWLAHGRVTRLVAQLEDALEGRGTIERAKGLLMGRLGIDDERAFELLVTQSNHENRRVREVAAALLAGAD